MEDAAIPKKADQESAQLWRRMDDIVDDRLSGINVT
jgi:hypothetical protein